MPEQVEELGGVAHDYLGSRPECGRRLVGDDGDPHREREVVDCAERVEVGRVVARDQRASQPTLAEQAADVTVHGTDGFLELLRLL